MDLRAGRESGPEAAAPRRLEQVLDGQLPRREVEELAVDLRMRTGPQDAAAGKRKRREADAADEVGPAPAQLAQVRHRARGVQA